MRDEFGSRSQQRRWWDFAIILAAISVFVFLGVRATVPHLAMNLHWVAALAAVLLVSLVAAAWCLERRTRFS